MTIQRHAPDGTVRLADSDDLAALDALADPAALRRYLLACPILGLEVTE